MIKTIQKIILGAVSMFHFRQVSLAADITSSDTVISKPVGAGLLPGSGNEGVDIQSSIVFSKIIPFAITWGINLAIGLTVLMFIFGGYLFLTSFGNEDRRSQAINTLFYSAIGLVIALVAYGIIAIITRIQLS